MGTVFLARGAGTLLSATASSKILSKVRGTTVLSLVLLILAGALFFVPYVSSVVSLHFIFFALGALTAMIGTVCQIMVLKVFGAKAAPWIGANAVAMGISGILVALIGCLTTSLTIQYSVIAATACLIVAILVILPAPEDFEGLMVVRAIHGSYELFSTRFTGTEDRGNEACCLVCFSKRCYPCLPSFVHRSDFFQWNI